MEAEAQIKVVLEEEAQSDDAFATLPIELDAIPGAVWRTELTALMPSDVRVTLFERGSQKLALLTFPPGERERAQAAFEQALQAANAVSQQSHRAAREARERRSSSPAEKPR